MLLAGDVGATKTRLALFTPEGGPRAPLAEKVFASRDYPDLQTMAIEFVKGAHATVRHAAFGVAGPVVEGLVKGTNLPWIVSEVALGEALGIRRAGLLNDIVATAYGVTTLEPDDLGTLSRGELVVGGSVAIVAPGTGLGEGFLVWDGERYVAVASEGGHNDYAPRTRQEMALLTYLAERYGHVSWERVCSGVGIPNVYAFLRDGGFGEEPGWLAAKLRAVADPTPVIVDQALSEGSDGGLCSQTMNLFVSILGAEAGNAALRVVATGGVYLGGGIPPRILSLLRDGVFLKAFRDKGRLAYLMEQMPVHVILNPRVALLGAASYGLSQLT